MQSFLVDGADDVTLFILAGLEFEGASDGLYARWIDRVDALRALRGLKQTQQSFARRTTVDLIAFAFLFARVMGAVIA